MWKRFWLVGALLAALALALTAVAGYEAGRRYRWATVDRWRAIAGHVLWRSPTTKVGWSPRAAGPVPRYEAGSLVAGGKIYVFGGFGERAINSRQLRVLARIDVYDPSTDHWQRMADMPSAVTHRNPVLAGDTVWLAGGFVGDDPGPATADTWKYDVPSDRWAAGPPLPQPRAGGALFHHAGRLHYIGGYGVDRNTSGGEHWILDLAAQEAGWRAAPPLPRPRGHFGGIELDGRFYLVGGTLRHDPVQADVDWVDRYDPATETWTEVASLPEPLSHIEPSAFAYKGQLVIAGGRNHAAPEEASDLLLSYDPTADRWLSLGRLPEGRVAPLARPVGDSLYFGLGSDATYWARDTHLWTYSLVEPWQRLAPAPVPLGEVTAVATPRGVLIVGEGSGVTLRYDPARDRWDAPSTLAVRPAQGNHHAGEWIDGRWYVVGGLGSQSVSRLVQIYDAAHDRWSFGPDLPWGTGSASSAVIGGMLYVAGGIDGERTVGTAARLDPRAGGWVQIASMPLPRNHAASATDGRRMYVFGGRGPGSGDGNTVANGFAETQIYDPATDQWSASGSSPDAPLPLPQARGGMGKALYVRGEFWVFGGETADGAGASAQHVYDRVDIYDPKRNRWRAGPAIRTARHGIFPVLIGDRIYVIAGGVRAARSASDIVEFLDLDRVGLASERR